MAITLKTITGKIVIPGTTIGIRAKVTATPMTDSQALTFPADDVISWGSVVATTDAAGVLPSSFKIPTSSAQQAQLLWKFVAEPVDKHAGLPKAWLMGEYQITGTGTIGLDDLVDVDVLGINTATYVTIQNYVAAAQAAATAAAAGAASSAASASLANTLVTSDLGTTDGQSYALVSDPNSQTGETLRNLFAARGDSIVDKITVGPDASVDRTGVYTHIEVDATTPGDTYEFLGHLLRTDVIGDYTTATSPNDGWVWGINAYTHTPPGAGNGAGIQYLSGMLCEVSLGGDDFTGIAWGLVAEAAYIGASAGGTADSLISLKVANPKRKDGATAGNANSVYGLYVDAVAPGSLGSSEAYSLYVAGGYSYFSGDVTVAGFLGIPASAGFYVGDRLIEDGGVNLTVNAPVEAPAFYTDGGAFADAFQYATDSSRKLIWGNGDPEGAVVAGQGSMYLRLDGGAGSTLHVKESGIGNTGWVGK